VIAAWLGLRLCDTCTGPHAQDFITQQVTVSLRVGRGITGCRDPGDQREPDHD